MSEANEILWSQQGAVVTITLNRPNNLNAITQNMTLGLRDYVDQINKDASIRCVILTGAGERAFSAGSDVKLIDEYGTNWQLRNRPEYCTILLGARKPVISAIRGYAIGGGLELALVSDIRIASETARFAAGEVKLGWHGGGGVTQFLPRLIGYGKALQMILTGDQIDAQEAYRVGLVQELVPDNRLEETSYALANKIAENAPIAVEMIKHLVRMSLSAPLEVGLRYENDTFTYLFTTHDHEEGIAAFKEKRVPQFKGE